MKNNSTKIIAKLQETYIRKNHDYGNSFDQSLNEDGLIAAKVRIGDKIRRINQLLSGDGQMVNDESSNDTLLDLANYAIMTLRWINDKCDNIEDSKIENLYKNLEASIGTDVCEMIEASIKRDGIPFICGFINNDYSHLSESLNEVAKNRIPAIFGIKMISMAMSCVVFSDYLTQHQND